MITYNMRKPVDCENSISVGVTGENLSFTQEFYIIGMTSTLDYSIHLRFADDSVNSVIPDNVTVDENGTLIRWTIHKTDIFTHGYFELQLEGRNSDELIFQTEIIKLRADESLAIEDKNYESPNTETLRLREEAYNALSEIKLQQEKINDNLKAIWNTDINKKADKADTIAGYGITDAYTKSETDTMINTAENKISKEIADKEVQANKIHETLYITNKKVNYPSIDYLENYYYDYSTTDDYLDEKFNSSEVESGSGNFVILSSADSKISSATFNYQKVGSFVDVFAYITFKACSIKSAATTIPLSGLPFICRNSVNPREMCVTTDKRKMLYAIAVNSSNINLLLFEACEINEDEKLSFNIKYKIS